MPPSETCLLAACQAVLRHLRVLKEQAQHLSAACEAKVLATWEEFGEPHHQMVLAAQAVLGALDLLEAAEQPLQEAQAALDEEEAAAERKAGRG